MMGQEKMFSAKKSARKNRRIYAQHILRVTFKIKTKE
jgi:hypothetical protein